MQKDPQLAWHTHRIPSESVSRDRNRVSQSLFALSVHFTAMVKFHTDITKRGVRKIATCLINLWLGLIVLLWGKRRFTFKQFIMKFKKYNKLA